MPPEQPRPMRSIADEIISEVNAAEVACRSRDDGTAKTCIDRVRRLVKEMDDQRYDAKIMSIDTLSVGEAKDLIALARDHNMGPIASKLQEAVDAA